MGLLTALRITNTPLVDPSYTSSALQIASPWSDSSNLLPALIAEEIYGLGALTPVTRAQAMMIPAIAKGRAILHAIIGNVPLRAYRGDTELVTQPTWLYRSDSGISPAMRTKMILDDLIFNEASLLAVKRGNEGQPIDATPIPYDDWSVNQDGFIEVNGTIAPADQVIYIPGPGPGLLAMAANTISAAFSTENAWAARVRNPFPAMVLQEVEDHGMTQDEAKTYVNSVAQARRNPDSAVMYMPASMRIESHAAESTDLYESGRNALRLDFANFLNIPASLLDGSTASASLTYSTQEGRRNELFDYTISYWASPIEEALSLDNVVPRGQRVRFDFANYLTPTPAPTGPNTQD